MAGALVRGGSAPVRLPLLMRAAETMLTAAIDERALLDSATMLLGDYFGYGTRSVLLWDRATSELYVASAGGLGADTPGIRDFRTGLGRGLTGTAAQLRTVINVGNTCDDPRYISTMPQCLSEICVPIVVHDELLGVITVQSDRRNAFSTDDEAVLTAFAQLLALALMHARTHEARRRDMSELQAIADVAREATSLRIDSTLKTLAERFRSLTTSDSVAIHLYDESRQELWNVELSYDPALYPADYIERVRDHPVKLGEGHIGWTALHRKPAKIDDTSKDPRPVAIRGLPLANKSAITVPLIASDKLLGVIRAVKMGVASYTDEHFRLAQTLADQVSVAIAAVQAYEEAQRLAITDDLTGCFNARHMTARLAEEVERAKRHGRALALLVADSDSLKCVNDRFGHADGDRLLVDLAANIRSSVRVTDVVARYGGDEFVVIAPETDLLAATATGERVRAAVAGRLFRASDGQDVLATVSIGVAALAEGDDAGALFGRADKALYRAKQLGKDRVIPIASSQP